MKPNRFNFRAYVKKYNKIYRVCELHTDNEYLTVQICDNDNTVVFDKDKKINPTLFSKNEIELMQSTGLVDMNGKEIYEEDILKFISEGRIIIFRIYFDKKRSCLCAKTLNDAIDCQIDKQFCSNKTIIGNSYENPELLEEI